MLPYLQKKYERFFRRLFTRPVKRDLVMVKKAYEQYGLDAPVSPFIEDMVSAYESSDLIIRRAGATSWWKLPRRALRSSFPFRGRQ